MALRIGAEEKKKVIIVARAWCSRDRAGSERADELFWRQLVSSATASTSADRYGSTKPSRNHHGHTSESEHAAARIPGVAASLDPTLHPEWMAQAESLEYSGRGRNIFSQSSAPPEIEQVKAPVRPTTPVAEVPQGPPPPPPIDLKFFGYEARKDGTRKAFLLHGEDVFIASEGDVVDHRYKVLKIAPFSVQVEDLPYKNAQPLPLVQN